ncbi:MAG: ATP phosphoribosyltransferase regulatory subunit, partial [Hydrogenobaculum sp.]
FYDKIIAVNGFLDLKASKVFKQFIVFAEKMLSEKGYSFIKLPVFDSFYNQMRTTTNYNELITIRSSKEVFVLRKDMTYQVASYIASLKERTLPIRIYYEGEVFSWESEIKSDYQLGLEYIGYDKDDGIFEVIDIVYKLLAFFNNDVFVYINDEAILKELMSKFDDRYKEDIKYSLMTKNLNTLSKYDLDWILLEDENLLFEKLDALGVDSTRLHNVYSVLKNKSLNVKLDISELKSIPYYDGITFSFYSPSHPFVIASGGEYQILKNVYNLDIKACGGAIYLSYILERL